MTSPHPTNSSETTLTQDLVNAVRYYLRGRRGLIIIATVTVIAGLALNWSWLVAAGIAPILLGVLPCLAMCALGLCMHRAVHRTPGRQAATRQRLRLPPPSYSPHLRSRTCHPLDACRDRART